jgi:ribonuclease E
MSDTTAWQPPAEPAGSPVAPAPTSPGDGPGPEVPESPPKLSVASQVGPASSADASSGAEGRADAAAKSATTRSSARTRRRRRRRPAHASGGGDGAGQDRLNFAADAPAPSSAERVLVAESAPGADRAPDADGGLDAEEGPGAAGASGLGRRGGPLPDADADADAGAGAPSMGADSPERVRQGPATPRIGERRPAPERPKIGDSRPAPPPVVPIAPVPVTPVPVSAPAAPLPSARSTDHADEEDEAQVTTPARTGGRSRRRSGRERRGRAVGRYLMCVHVRPHATQIAVLEGRTLVEHYVSRASDDTAQIDGNIYRGRVQNVLPGMEAAFVDIGTPKNAVLYRGDVRYDREDVETAQRASPRIEEMLRPGQTILCQVTKNPIGAKGARLTQEVSLPGRFVVMVPNSTAFGISKRLDDNERKRLRRIVDEVRPAGHGLIVRTAAEGASQDELRHDVDRLVALWAAIDAEANRSNAPGLLYREPDLAVRIVREEFNRDYRGVVIDDEGLYNQVRDYVQQVNPELVQRVEYYDPVAEHLPVFERFHVHEQLHKALDRKVWLPSGGSIIVERTEALTVIDVNTGKNVGTSNLEETVYRNNLEAAEEIARQLRLRDIGGIIVIDFIDMEIKDNRERVAAALRSALARDKTRTQVFDISELGLVEMTRKRVSEGLVESLSSTCAVCGGRGIVLDESLL